MDINEANKALLDGAYTSNVAKVAEALENGADVNFRDSDGTTPLHAASFAGKSLEICKMLIERGADVEARESMGCAPLHFVADSGNPEIGKLLLEHGAKVDAVDISDKTPLYTALEEGSYEFCKLLLEYGADPNYECEDDEMTALEFAELCANGEYINEDYYAEPIPMPEEQYREIVKLMKQKH